MKESPTIELKKIEWDHDRLTLEIWEEEEPIASCEIYVSLLFNERHVNQGGHYSWEDQYNEKT